MKQGLSEDELFEAYRRKRRRSKPVKQEDLYYAQAVETFLQFLDNSNPAFKDRADEVEYDLLRKRIQDLTRQQRLEAAQGTTKARNTPAG